MPTLEFHQSTLHVRERRSYTGVQTNLMGSMLVSRQLCGNALWFRPTFNDMPDKGTANIEFYRQPRTIVFRDPRSAPASVTPDIARQTVVNLNHNNRQLPVDITIEFPVGATAFALILASDMPERLVAVPFESLDKTVTPGAPPDLAEAFVTAREQDYSRDGCRAIGEVMTHEVFLAAFPHVFPAAR